MASLPSYEDAHLIVAAVRVLQHREGGAPTPASITDLLGLASEKVHVLVHQLRERGVLYAYENPFELRLEVKDVALLESLPHAGSEPEIKGELDEFHEREREKKAEMDRMFLGGEADKRRAARVKKLEDEFKTFKPKGGRPDGLFKNDDTAD